MKVHIYRYYGPDNSQIATTTDHGDRTYDEIGSEWEKIKTMEMDVPKGFMLMSDCDGDICESDTTLGMQEQDN